MFLKPLLTILLSVFVLSGCGTIQAPPYTPNYEKIDQFSSDSLSKVSLGEFLPTDKNAPVNKVSLRAMNLGTSQGHFAGYLQASMKSDLREMGIYNPNSSRSIEANILENDIDISGLNEGTGTISVDVTILENEQTLFMKNYKANTQFESAFLGSVAITRGANEYPVLIKTLLSKIYQDSEFIRALSK